MNRVEQVNN